MATKASRLVCIPISADSGAEISYARAKSPRSSARHMATTAQHKSAAGMLPTTPRR